MLEETWTERERSKAVFRFSAENRDFVLGAASAASLGVGRSFGGNGQWQMIHVLFPRRSAGRSVNARKGAGKEEERREGGGKKARRSGRRV